MTDAMTDAWSGSTAALAPISLEQLAASAELLARIDRKYVLDASVMVAMVADPRCGLAVLDVDGRREFTYESIYFDTPGLDLYRDAATGRRHRFKVRTRLYADTGVTMLEVKTKDGRGRTIKYRIERDAADRHQLSDDDRRFVDSIIAPDGRANELIPTLTTRYRRTSLVDVEVGARATVDQGLVCSTPDGRSVSVEQFIVETKSGGAASPLDRWFWRRGIRPVRISKYCTALAAMHSDLPTNKWHRTIGTHFGG